LLRLFGRLLLLGRSVSAKTASTIATTQVRQHPFQFPNV
jgi:hypothetical protein